MSFEVPTVIGNRIEEAPFERKYLNDSRSIAAADEVARIRPDECRYSLLVARFYRSLQFPRGHRNS